MANPVMKSAQESLIQLLDARRVVYTSIDCTLPENRELRASGWAISGLRAVYPQVFTRDASGTLAFVGDWDTINSLNESNDDLHGLDAALNGVERK